MFGDNCKQMPSKEAIMFKAYKHYYKVPVNMTDFWNLYVYQLMNTSVKLKNFISLMEVPTYSMFKYPAVRPLTK